MKNEMQIFKNDEFGEVRTITIDDEPWFVGKDVAMALGYSNPSKVVLNHVDDEDKTFMMLDIADSQNGNVLVGQSKTALINESGLYGLIMSSKLPSAKRFKRWVTSEVLPTIRKTGSYSMLNDNTNSNDYLKAAEYLSRCIDREVASWVKGLLEQAGFTINSEIKYEVPEKESDTENEELSNPFVKLNHQKIYGESAWMASTLAVAYGQKVSEFNKKLEELGIQHKDNNVWYINEKYAGNGYSVRVKYKYPTALKWTDKGCKFLYEILKNNGILPVI